ncbi:unnamed protein product [Caretta caretta]
MEGLALNLINVYAPTSSPKQMRFSQQASAFLGSLDSRECLVLGWDINTTLKEQDHSGTEQCPAATHVLRKIVDHHSLVDIWHNHHLDDVSTFTYVWVEAHRSCNSCLDCIYFSHHQLSQAHSSGIQPALFSDHHLVTEMASRGRGQSTGTLITACWKMWASWRPFGSSGWSGKGRGAPFPS